VRGPLPDPPARYLRHRPWREAEYAALDFELTGLEARRPEVVSYGLVPVRKGRVVIGESAYREVRPPVTPDPGSIRVHGLRPADLEGAPRLDDVRDPLRRALDGRFLLAWAAGIEVAVLGRVFGGRPWRWFRRTLDVRLLAAVLDRLEGRPVRPDALTLVATARRYGVPLASPHHALEDALATASLFLIVASKLSERGVPTVSALLRATRPNVARR